MADPEHLAILKQGVEAWNEWREANPKVKPDLSNRNGGDFQYFYFRKIDLEVVDFSRTSLALSNFANMYAHNTNFEGANLIDVNFTRSSMNGANFSNAYLLDANLSSCFLSGANFSGSFCSGANFSEAILSEAIFHRTELKGTNFTRAAFGSTVLTSVDLSNTKGLGTSLHFGASTIGIDTLFTSQGQIPEAFLRGAGVPDTMIEYMQSIVNTKAIQYYSCFISHSGKDEGFAKRLHNDLQGEGVRCWFSPEDMKIGDRIRPAIDRAIRLHDKLLIVLSEKSVASDWVEDEVEAALERERREDKTILFPIRIDDAVMDSDIAWAAKLRRQRHIGEFANWKDKDAYQKAFDRLLRDLKAAS